MSGPRPAPSSIGRPRRTRLSAIAASALTTIMLAAPIDARAAQADRAQDQLANVDTLANVLSTAFLAKNLTLVCVRQDKWFAEDTKGPEGDGAAFSDHVEGEVLARLDKNDAGLVVIGAANAARAVSLGLLHVMSDGSGDEQPERIADWCASTAKPLVRGILAQHEIRHDLYDLMLARAKR